MMLSADEILHLASDRYGEGLYWHIRRIVVSKEDAEDALQETFIKIYTKASTFRGDRNNLMAWCYRIATNEALHILRKRSGLFRSLDSAGKELAEMVATEGGPDADKSEILFQQALMQLGTQQRIVFTLRYYDDLSYKQIEEITTGKSQNTLRANYHYAVNKIKEYLKENSI